MSDPHQSAGADSLPMAALLSKAKRHSKYVTDIFCPGGEACKEKLMPSPTGGRWPSEARSDEGPKGIENNEA